MNRNRRNQDRANFGGHWRFIRAGVTLEEFTAMLTAVTEWQRLVLNAAMDKFARLSADVQRGTQPPNPEDQ